MSDEKSSGERDPKVMAEIASFLHEFYSSFELADLECMAKGLSEDFSALFHIPSRGPELIPFDKKSILEGSAQAFAAYKDRGPLMKVTHLNVWPRSSEAAIASYELDFYLGGDPVDVALAIADLSKERGEWKILRLYENKRG